MRVAFNAVSAERSPARLDTEASEAAIEMRVVSVADTPLLIARFAEMAIDTVMVPLIDAVDSSMQPSGMPVLKLALTTLAPTRAVASLICADKLPEIADAAPRVALIGVDASRLAAQAEVATSVADRRIDVIRLPDALALAEHDASRLMLVVVAPIRVLVDAIAHTRGIWLDSNT